MAANNSYEEAVALIAAANRVVQDPNSVGAALRTISLRLRGTSVKELEEAGEDTAGAVTSKSKLRNKVKALSGVDILTDTGSYKSTYEILLEISKVWEDMSDIDQAALLEIIAGKTRSNTAAAILSNTTDLEEAYVQSLEAEGSALEENEKYLDSIQGKIDLFTNATQTMWNNALDSEVIKGFVALGTELIKLIDKVGLLQSLLIALSGYAMIKHKMGPITFFTELINLIPKSIKGIQLWILNMQKSDAATIAGIKTKTADTVATNANTAANMANAASSVVAGEAEDKDTRDTLENTSATVTDTITTATNTVTNNANAVSNAGKVTKGGKVVGSVKAIKTTSTATPVAGVGAGATGALAGLTSAIPYILGVVAILAIAGVAYAHFHKSAEELKEELTELQSEAETTRSKIDSINSEIETTRNRIAELEALPSLSFTDEEELNKLKQQNEQLELTLELQEQLLESQEKAAANKLAETANSLWNGVDPNGSKWDKAYYVTTDGIIEEDHWWSIGQTAPEALDTAMKKYESYNNTQKIRDEILRNFDEYSDEELKSKMYEFNTASFGADGLMIDPNKNRDKIKKYLEDADYTEKMSYIANSIDNVLGSEEFANLAYGDDEKVNSIKNELLTKLYEWNNIQGGQSDSKAIASLFNSGATIQMKNLEEDIQEIMDTNKSWEEKNKLIKEHLEGIDETAKGYEHLNLVLSSENLDVTKQSIADYFTLTTGEFNSSTLEGVIRQYQTGVDILSNLKESGVAETAWDDILFELDDSTDKFKVRKDEFGEMLKGMDEDAREAFYNIAESVKNGDKSWDQAITSMTMSGILASTKILEQQWTEVNKNMFKSIDDGVISGWIDTFSELSAALEDVASSMDLLHTAQQQMNNSGRISIKTALELIETTDNWEKILTITGDTITLTSDAEDQLVQSKLNVIKAQVDEALGAVELQLAQLGAADSAYTVAIASDVSDEAYEQYTNAMNSYSASIAAFGAALDALLDNDPNTKVLDSFRSVYDTAKKVANSSADTTRINREDLEQRRKDLQAQKDILNQSGTVSSFKNNYDYDKTPGDKYKDDDDDEDDAFQKYRKPLDSQVSLSSRVHLTREVRTCRKKGRRQNNNLAIKP